ncbi:DUF6174 domain-containing protein [Actinoplanes sp. NPDC049548]|uniref:DUF6174 domain-containing protein n=1 Tax=Actinoplanes sp. NPDC049548 TaxID=3155152 RepID=UPI0034189A64
MTRNSRSRLLIAGGACLAALTVWAVADRQPATWVEPPAYTYTVRFRCGMASPPGQYTLTVADGTVGKAVADDPLSRQVMEVRQLEPGDFPTLGKLFREYRQAWSEGADVTEISLDPVDGHPTRIRLDVEKESVDDESCYDIVAFTAS